MEAIQQRPSEALLASAFLEHSFALWRLRADATAASHHVRPSPSEIGPASGDSVTVCTYSPVGGL
jgi:hypothetical protein